MHAIVALCLGIYRLNYFEAMVLGAAGTPVSGLQCGSTFSSLRCQHMMLRLSAWRPSRLPQVIRASAETNNGDTASEGDLTESQLARLEKVEREAASLREQLKLAQQIQVRFERHATCDTNALVHKGGCEAVCMQIVD